MAVNTIAFFRQIHAEAKELMSDEGDNQWIEIQKRSMEEGYELFNFKMFKTAILVDVNR